MDALIEGALQRGDGGESLLSQLSESRLSDRELHARLSSLCALLCGSESRLGLLVVPASTSAYATTQSLAMALLRRVLGTLHEPSAALLYGMNSDHLPVR